MWKLFNNKILLLIVLGSIATVIGLEDLINTNKSFADTSNQKNNLFTNNTALSLGNSPVNTPNSFLLASDLIARKEGKAALAKLDGLEQEYPLLAAHVLLAKGEAYQLEQNYPAATKTWQEVVATYPTSAATGDALYQLGKSQPEYWQQAIARFPSHPRTHEIIHQQLRQNPNQPHLMAILVKYTPDDPGVEQMRDRLFKDYAHQLTPEEWSAIGDSYWLKWDYGKAGQAYAKAPKTARNLYRAGRGYHLANSKVTAKQYYLQLVQQHPHDDYTE